MNDVETVTVHQFGSGLFVELIGVDEYSEPATESVEFDIVAPEENKVIPRETIPADHEHQIREALSEEGYALQKE